MLFHKNSLILPKKRMLHFTTLTKKCCDGMKNIFDFQDVTSEKEIRGLFLKLIADFL